MVHRYAQSDRIVDEGALPDVGLYVDDERSIAAVSHPTRSNPSLHIASLHATVLFVHGDGSASLGGTDDPDAEEFTGFTHEIGDEPETGYSAADLTAMTWLCLLTEVAKSTGTPFDALAAAATYPADWTAEQIGAVRESMNYHDLGHVALVAEADALRAWSESTLSTWAGSDSGIAAARGAATMAGDYPVDAVTEEIPRIPARRSSPRTPILVAAGFAALLTVAAGVAALALRSSDTTTVPTIDSAEVAAPSSTYSAPSPQLPFPTVAPILEPQAPAVVAPIIEVAPTTEPDTSTPVAPEPPATRPAAETTEAEVTTPEPADDEPPTSTDPVTEEPVTIPDPGGEDTGGGVDDGEIDPPPAPASVPAP